MASSKDSGFYVAIPPREGFSSGHPPRDGGFPAPAAPPPRESGGFTSVPTPNLPPRAPIFSPRIAHLVTPTPRVTRVSDGETYVEDAYEGSLVHYYPTERKIGKWEQKFTLPGGFWGDFFGIHDFFNPEVWRAALSEFVATTVLIFVCTTGAITCLQGGFMSPMLATAVVEFLALSFMILAAAPASGGHLNPAITVATMLTGFSTPVRALLYVISQTAGSAVGALAVQVVVSEKVAEKYALGGCTLRNTVLSDGVLVEGGISTGAGLLSEFLFTLALLYIAFSVALDPKQFQVTGPIIAPFIIGAVIGSLLFISSGLRDVVGGYTGAGMNPARCFGPAVAMGGQIPILWRDQWVFWVGPLLSCLALSILYHIIPPHHVELYRSRKDIFSHIRSFFSSSE